MPLIKNSTELADSITANIESAASGFSLSPVNLEAAANVEVEAECSTTYKAGVGMAEVFKTHLNNAATFVNQVSTKLDEADKKVFINNRAALNRPFLQGADFDAQTLVK